MKEIKELSQLKVYTVPYERGAPRVNVEHIELTVEQAKAAGWHYRKKSRDRLRITGYTGTEEDIIVPANIGGLIVNELGHGAFMESTVRIIRIPNTVKKYMPGVFMSSGVEKVFIADGNESIIIPENAFYECKKLSEIHLPINTHRIEKKAFYRCRELKYIRVPSWCMYIGESCFALSGLEGVSLNYSTMCYCERSERLSVSAFYNTPLQSRYDVIIVPSSPCKTVLWIDSYVRVRFREPGIAFLKGSIRDYVYIDLSYCNDIRLSKESFSNFEKLDKLPLYLPNSCSDMKWVRELVDAHRLNKRNFILNPGDDVPQSVPEDVLLVKDSINHWGISEIRFGRMRAASNETIRVFSESCRSLHKISWLKEGKEVTLYLPVADFQSGSVRKSLLDTLTLKNDSETGEGRFFDVGAFEKVFKNVVGNYNALLSRRDRIFIALDALRSSALEHKLLYKRFLMKHRDFALKIAHELPEEYCLMLEEFFNDTAAAKEITADTVPHTPTVQGKLIGCIVTYTSKGTKLNSNNLRSIDVHMRCGEQLIYYFQKRAFEEKKVTVYRAKNDVLEELGKLAGRENMAQWEDLRSDNDPDNSSSASLVLYFDDAGVGENRYSIINIDLFKARTKGKTAVEEEFTQILYKAIAMAEVIEPENGRY